MALVQIIQVTNAGGTFVIDQNNPPDVVFIYATGAVTLGADFVVSLGGVPSNGTTIRYITQAIDQVVKGVYAFTIEGNEITETQMDYPFQYVYQFADATAGSQYSYIPQLDGLGALNGTVLIDGTIDLIKLASGTDAQVPVCNVGGVPVYVTISGDITITNAGVTAITAGAIVNADINAAAAIARTKLASGTASQVLINDGSGVMSSEAQLATVRGGTGQDTSSSTGFPAVASGTWGVGALTETLRLDVSFEVGWQGTYYMTVPFPCTVTAAKARVTKDLSGTDAGTIQLQDNSGTNFTGGLITIPLGSVHGTGVTATAITANNVFTAGQEIRFLVDKPTDGGACSIDVTITRLTLS